MLPPLTASRLGSTDLALLPSAMILAAAALYGWGVVRNNRLHPRHRWPWWRTAVFMGGLLVTGVAVESFIGLYDQVLFWDHMVQHLMLVMVAAAMFAVGSPLALAFRSSSGATHRWVVRALRSKISTFLARPLVAFIAYAIVIPLTHLTSFYNYSIENRAFDDLEHLIFLVVGYLFWRQIFGIDPNRTRMHPGMQLAYLFLAVPVDTFTGLTLTAASHEMFPAYLAMHRTWGPSPLLDLHTGGALMWVGGDTLMFLPMIPVAVRWVHYEERKAVRVDRELERMRMTAEDAAALGGALPGMTSATSAGSSAAPAAPKGGWRTFLPPPQQHNLGS